MLSTLLASIGIFGICACTKNDAPIPSVIYTREDTIVGNYHTIKSYHGSSPTSSFDTIYGERDITIQKAGNYGLAFIDPDNNDTLVVSYHEAYSSAYHIWYYCYPFLGGDYIKYDPNTGKLNVGKGNTYAGGSSYFLWEGYKVQ